MKQWCLLSFVVLFTILKTINGHSYHLGACPVVEPMPGFDMNKFLGEWYVIQKTSTASDCIIYNFTRGEEPGQYQIEQISQHFFLKLTPLDHEYHYKGILSVPDAGVPGKMVVKFPLSVAGSASYTIIGTDYENYAGVFTCQKLTFAHRQSATILSRTKTLDKVFIDKIRNRLSTFNIDPYELSIINQSNCPKHKPGSDEGVNINIDDQTFTAHSAAEVVRKAGEKIGDGIEYVATGAKKLYNKVAGGSDTSSSSNNDDKRERYHARNPKEETEWLP